jgi:hypothetical protein
MPASESPQSTVWRGLLRDVGTSCCRCKTLVDGLQALELTAHRERAAAGLEAIIAEVHRVIDDELDDGAVMSALETLGGSFDIFRRTQLPFFAHYGPDERYLTLLAEQLAEEAGFTIPTPIVGTFSSSGYWTIPDPVAVCLPAVDYGQLLAFPDLVHELAHILLEELDGALTGRFLSESIGPYATSLGAVEGDPEFADALYSQYQDWFIEFAADVIATYICGPAYGWQNVRLRAQGGPDLAMPWQPAKPAPLGADPEPFSHPADDPRAAVIGAVLRGTGESVAADRIQAEWESLTAHVGQPPHVYEISYPRTVLDDVVSMTLEWCRAIPLIPHADAGAHTVVAHIRRAWELQLADPVAFAANEDAMVAELRALVESAADADSPV